MESCLLVVGDGSDGRCHAHRKCNGQDERYHAIRAVLSVLTLLLTRESECRIVSQSAKVKRVRSAHGWSSQL